MMDDGHALCQINQHCPVSTENLTLSVFLNAFVTLYKSDADLHVT